MSQIVVGYDGTPASERALQVAARSAATRHVPLRVVTVWSTVPYLPTWPGMGYDVLPPRDDLTGVLTEAAREAVSRIEASTGTAVQAEYDVRPGDVRTQLVEAAKGAELLVLGARRHGGFVSALVGSATNAVLHHAPCPVLVVGPQAGESWGKVVVGADGSECSQAAMRFAAERAREAGCRLVVVHAWEVVTTPEWLALPAPDPHQHDDQVRSWLDAHVQQVLGDPGTALDVVSVHDRATTALLAAAAPDDLLVLGSRGRSALSDAVLGSVAMSCLHHARSSVAVVRSDEEPGS